MIDEALLAILACPNCEERPPLRLVAERLVCDKCNCYYPVEEGIPNLLPESAIPFDKNKES
jgi:uncharacterized protein YbaR (Trm112 family)